MNTSINFFAPFIPARETYPSENPTQQQGSKVSYTQEEAIRRIREGLSQRTNKEWSVTKGHRTASGWIKISAPPTRLGIDGNMTEPDRHELLMVLGLRHAKQAYISVPASGDYYQEYVDRAEGKSPSRFGTAYWK